MIDSRIVRSPHGHPSFVEGMARVMDVGGTLNQYGVDYIMGIVRELQAHRLVALSGLEAETKAMQEVWVTVGQCIGDAISSSLVTSQDAVQVWTYGNEQAGRK